jgi:hypothetical protein
MTDDIHGILYTARPGTPMLGEIRGIAGKWGWLEIGVIG